MTLYQYQIQKVSIILNRQSEWSSSWEVNNHLGSRSTAAALQHWTNSTPTPPASSSHTRVTQTSLYATSAFLLYIVSFQKIHCPHSKGRTIQFFKHGFSSRNIYIFFSFFQEKETPWTFTDAVVDAMSRSEVAVVVERIVWVNWARKTHLNKNSNSNDIQSVVSQGGERCFPTDVMKNSHKIIIIKNVRFQEAIMKQISFFPPYESSGLHVTGSRIVYECICASLKILWMIVIGQLVCCTKKTPA